MSKDLFAPNGYAYLDEDEFRWIVGVFRGNGAMEVIKRANGLKIFYPVRLTFKGEYVPVWRNYLFVEFKESITINLCRTTPDFIKVISERDDDGMLRPVLIRKNAIDESMRLITQGKFDDIVFKRQFRGKGSIVRVIDGAFQDKVARLEQDVTPEMKGSYKVPISVNGVKCKIELFKLAL